MAAGKPWDARLAARVIRPLRESGLSPNLFTGLRLLFGVLACVALCAGGYLWSNIGAVCFVTSHFLDHTDGEYARLTGRMTRFGHYFDLSSDGAVNILLFLGIGIGLRRGDLGPLAAPMGLIAGLSVAAIFHLRLRLEDMVGRERARQPHLGALEAEDVLYLLPALTLGDLLEPFLYAACIGAPLFAAWVARDYLAVARGKLKA